MDFRAMVLLLFWIKADSSKKHLLPEEGLQVLCLIRCFAQSVAPFRENGEFDTFYFDGPIFSEKVPVSLRETVMKSYSFQDSEGKVHIKHFGLKILSL